MTTYTTKEQLGLDTTPGPLESILGSVGKGIQGATQNLPGILNALAQNKAQQLKASQELNKNKFTTKQRVGKTLKDTGRGANFNADEIDEISKISMQYLDQGLSPEEADYRAIEDYENPDYIPENATGLDILKKAKRNEQPLEYRTKARVWDLFKPRETEESIQFTEQAREKARKSNTIDDLSFEEIASLRPQDVEHMPKEEKEKFMKVAEFASKRAASIGKTAVVPFVGGALEERFREKALPGSARPPAIADISRLAAELPFIPALGGGNLLEKGIRGAAFFGGDAAVNEAVRTIGTEKPADLKMVGIQALVGGLFPVGEAAVKGISKGFRNAVAKEMKKSGSNASEATAQVLKDAEKAGINIESLEKGSEKEAAKFTQYLTEEGTTTKDKIKRLPKYRPETTKKGGEAPKRFAKEAKTLAKTPIEEYTKPFKETKASAYRRQKLSPELAKTKDRITELEKDLYKNKGAELQKTRDELADMRYKKYQLEHEIKYGKKPPTEKELVDQAKRAAEKLVGMIMEPTEGTLKAIRKNDKMMQTFLDKAKDQVVKGKLPDKFASDTFLGIQDAYLKAYKDLQRTIKDQMLIPYSNIRGSGYGQMILDELEKRIKGIKAAIKTQTQKRKVQRALTGPTGKFYRKWVDDLKKDQRLFTKDMIRIHDRITKGEKNLTPIAKERIEKAAASATKKGKKQIVKEAQEAGFKEGEAKKIAKSIEEIKNPPIFGSWENYRKWSLSNMNALLQPIKNQAMAGFILGSVDAATKEATGKKLPYKLKNTIYSLVGVTGVSGSRLRPILTASSFLTDTFWDWARKTYHGGKVKSKRGRERVKEYERLKNKGFTQKELKEMLS